MMRKSNRFKELVPPILWQGVQRAAHLRKRRELLIAGPDDTESLFDGDDGLFKRVVADASVYGEYGVGQSTVWVRNHTNAHMICVDSDPAWIGAVRERVANSRDMTLLHVDLGPLGEWGKPIGHAHRTKFETYPDALWQNGQNPDTILIDGRFRACCFFSCLMNGSEGTRILFDDYVGRPEYYVVEEFLRPAETCGRQALFIRPPSNQLNLDDIAKMKRTFSIVKD